MSDAPKKDDKKKDDHHDEGSVAGKILAIGLACTVVGFAIAPALNAVGAAIDNNTKALMLVALFGGLYMMIFRPKKKDDHH